MPLVVPRYCASLQQQQPNSHDHTDSQTIVFVAGHELDNGADSRRMHPLLCGLNKKRSHVSDLLLTAVALTFSGEPAVRLQCAWTKRHRCTSRLRPCVWGFVHPWRVRVAHILPFSSRCWCWWSVRNPNSQWRPTRPRLTACRTAAGTLSLRLSLPNRRKTTQIAAFGCPSSFPRKGLAFSPLPSSECLSWLSTRHLM